MDDILNLSLKVRRALPLTVSLATAILLVGAVFHWPYAYYIFLRIEVCLVFGWAAYLLYKSDFPVIPWVTLGVAILFNPIEKIYLDRSVWFYIDIVCAAYIMVIHFLLRYRVSGKFI